MSNNRLQFNTPFSNVVRLSSPHTTCTESRDRARFHDRSRSPQQRDRADSARYCDRSRSRSPEQRDRFNSVRYERNEGSSSVRSPWDSSLYHQPNYPATSRKTSASDRPSPEVGIRIRGRAANADSERKQREQEAKVYRANLAREMLELDSEKANPLVKTTQVMEATDEISADPIGLSWKDKAEAAADSKGEGNGARNDDSTATQRLAKIFEDIIEEMSEQSSLKARKANALAKLNKAKAEFVRSKDHHEKFPSIKEAHHSARKAADKEYQKADERIKQRDIPLRQLALQAAEQVVPSILDASSSTQDHQKTQDRLDGLERTCQKYEELLREQRSYLEDQQKANHTAAEGLERKYNVLAQDLRVLKSEATKDKSRMDKFFAKQNDFVNITNNVSKKLEGIKDHIAALSKIEIPPNLSQELQKLNGLVELRAKLKTVDDYSASTQSGLAKLVMTVDSLGQSVDALKTTVTTLEERNIVTQTLTQEQEKLRGTVSDISDRVGSVETKIPDAKQLDELKHRISRVETAPPSSVAPTMDLAITTQLASLEEKSMTMSSQLAGFKDLAGFQDLESRLAALERSHRALEQQQQQQQQQQTHPCASKKEDGSASAPAFNILSDQIVKLKEDLDHVQSDIDAIPELTGETVKESVDFQMRLIESRLSAFETSLKKADDQLQSQHTAIQDVKDITVDATAMSAVEIIKSRNIFALASIDEKFMTSLNHINTSLMEHIEAQSLAIGNLQNRMDNLNTSDVHAAMVNSLNQTYPNLRNSESHGSQLLTLNARINSLQKEIGEIRASHSSAAALAAYPAAAAAPASASAPAPLAGKSADTILAGLRISELTMHSHSSQLSTLSLRTSQLQKEIEEIRETPTSAPAASPVPPVVPRHDDTILKGLRLEVDELTKHNARLQRLEKDLAAFREQTAADFALNKEETADLSEELATKYYELTNSSKELDKRVSSLGEKLRGIEKKQQQQQQVQVPSVTVSRNSFQGSGPSFRQVSVSSDTSSIHAKRKLASLNGSDSSNTQKSNGTRFQHGTPNSKRLRRSKVDDDSDQDPNYEDRGDSDEDESLPPPPLKSEKVVIDLSD